MAKQELRKKTGNLLLSAWLIGMSVSMVPSTSVSAVLCESVFSKASSQFTREAALTQLYNDRSLPWTLRFNLGQEIGKLPWLNRSSPQNVSASSKDALIWLLNAPENNVDKGLRKKLFELTPVIFDGKTAQALLLPIARGVKLASPEDLYFSHEALRKISASQPSVPALEPIARISNLGGGWNTTLLVEFGSGKKAVFKPFLGQRNLGLPEQWVNRVAFNREVTAVPLIEKYLKNRASRENHLSPLLVPDTMEVSLSHEGVSYGVGSLQTFMEGYQGVATLKKTNPSAWDVISQRIEWKSLEARVRTIDYILGNPDRFENPGYKIPHYEAANLENIMMPKNISVHDPLQALLIDNAFGRPGAAEFGEVYLPPIKDIPADLRAAILDFDKAGFAEEMKFQLPAEGIQDVLQRIEKLQTLFAREERL